MADDNDAAEKPTGVAAINYVIARAEIENRPELWDENIEYLQAFFILSPTRNTGMSVGAIQIREILAYCEILDVQDRELFFRNICAADNAYLTWNRQRNGD